MKESVTKFDLEAAFKALDELEIPVAEKGIAANRVNLKETFNRKLKTEALIEDYYDVNNSEDLNQAEEERKAEVAQAKLARIEKIVDLDAETEEDILPSYEGKVIVQCPQCMTLFYKNPEDVEASEDDDTIVNVGEVCQHCGNESGYTVIGKVAAIEPEAEETDESDINLNLDNEEAVGENEEETPAEEPAEETSDEPAEQEPAEDEAELELEPIEDESEEDKKEEALNSSTKTVLTEDAEETVDEEPVIEEESEESEEEITVEEDSEEPIEEPVENKDALEVLKDKIDVHVEGDTVIIAEKGQLDNEEAPKVEIEVSEEEFDTLEKEFHEEETVEETEEDPEIEEASDSKDLKESTTKNTAAPEVRKLLKGLDDHLDLSYYQFAKQIKNDNKTFKNFKDAEHAITQTYYALMDDYCDKAEETTKLSRKELEKAFVTQEGALNKVLAAAKKEWASDSKDLKESLSDTMDRFEMQEFLEDSLGKDETLEALVRAMSEDQMKDLFDYIVRMYDLENEEDEEIEEALIVKEDISDAEFKELMNSDEYKEPISVEEVKAYWGESLHKTIAESLDSIENISEDTLNKAIKESLQQVYENVSDFEVKNCSLDDNKLKVEGLITFVSGNTRPTTYVFTEATINTKNKEKIMLEGYNNVLDPNGKFYLEGYLQNKKANLVAEKLTYSYHINDTLVEKLN